jgi:hypothetical protein
MLAHFRDAQTDLSALPTAADVYHQQPPHQANAVSEMANLVAQRLLEAMPPVEEPALPPAPLANAAHQLRESDLQARKAAMHTQMQEMMALMRASSNNRNCDSSNNRNDDSSNNRNREQGQGNSRSNDLGRGCGRSNSGPTTRSYCWTHDACAHNGSDCNTPIAGHQAEAAFANMLGGSTEGCYWLHP